MMISKESLKSNFLTMDQILSHKFFTEFASIFDKSEVEIAEALRKAALKEISGKESIVSAVQKTEQRLRDEQKLVSQKRGWRGRKC